ncbi:MAG: phage holin family protein [Thermomicrobiaceae bacterium]|nr:phage holin family protein [Thermomicrobiaceae bacterium]
MTSLLAHLVANALAVVVLANVLPHEVAYSSTEAVIVFAIVLAVLNAVVRPVLSLIALPVTCLTLGLFAVIVNAIVFYLAGRLSAGISITFLGAIVGAVVAGVLNGLLSDALRRRS